MSKSEVCETRSPYCWNYKTPPCSQPCKRVTPCAPYRSVCPPPELRCRRTVDDCCARERFASSCSPLYTPPPGSVCCSERAVPCYPRERFTSSCSSPGPQAARGPDTECAACDLDSYCIKSSPLICNPCLGRRSFRHCSSFTRPPLRYCRWCSVGDGKYSRRSSTRKKSRKSSNKRSSSSTSGRNSSTAGLASNVDKEQKDASRKSSKTQSVVERQTINDPNLIVGKSKKSGTDFRKSTLGDSGGSISSAASSVSNVDGKDKGASTKSPQQSTQSDVKPKTINDPNKCLIMLGKMKKSGKSSRKSTSARPTRRTSSKGKTAGSGRKTSTLRARFSSMTKVFEPTRKFPRRPTPYRSSSRSSCSSANRNDRPSSMTTSEPSGNSSVVAITAEDNWVVEENGRLSYSRKASQKSSAADSPRRSFGDEVEVEADEQSPSGKASQRSSKTNWVNDNSQRNCFSASPSSSGSSDSSVSQSDRRSSTRAEGDDRDQTDGADNLVKPLAECIAGIIHKSVGNQCDTRHPCRCDRCSGQNRAVSRPSAYCWNRRRSPTANACRPRDRFALCRMPFYRTGHRTTGPHQTKQQCGSASVVAYNDRQSHIASAHFVPDAQAANRQTQGSVIISSMPPPAASIPRPTITATPSSRQVSVTAQRPVFAGYREHHVTTTSQTVRFAQDQNFNYTSNAAARRSLEDDHRARSAVDNRNQSGVTSPDHGVSADVIGDVIADTRDTTSSPAALVSRTERADETPNVPDQDLAAMFEEAERGIMEVFDNAQQILR